MLKEYVIDLRDYDGKIRELISTGLQEHAFTLGWKGWTVGIPGEVRYTDSDVLYFDNDGIIKHSFLVDDDFDNTPISPAAFLALTPEDVQDNSGTTSAACTPEKLGFDTSVWDGAPDWATNARVRWTNPDYPEGMNETFSELYTRELPKTRARQIAEKEGYEIAEKYGWNTAARELIVTRIESALNKYAEELKAQVGEP